jgi:hypothetical protein
MQLAGDGAEVAECCAEWRFKSKLNYALHELGNSIGRGTGREKGIAIRFRKALRAALELRLGCRGSV